MGEVYRAHDTTLGRDVALKMLPEALAANPDSLARFEREARALGALNHSNIAQIYGVEAANHSRADHGTGERTDARRGPSRRDAALVQGSPLAHGFSSPIRRIPGSSSRSRAGRSRSRSNTRRSGSDGLK